MSPVISLPSLPKEKQRPTDPALHPSPRSPTTISRREAQQPPQPPTAVKPNRHQPPAASRQLPRNPALHQPPRSPTVTAAEGFDHRRCPGRDEQPPTPSTPAAASVDGSSR
ncbi:hypothetical protein CMV_027491 [Castanea mollissima]|uniref:Uncharacterized protein n=1 Tax=Castanea mollissima TaxID=60419 RepID=A0A8J4QBM1_9ROSI|nr:hypothetical protein CMV_027491 [Castanea mollissima]